MTPFQVLLGVVAFVGGGYVLAYGHARWRVARTVASAPDRSIGDLDSEGMVKLSGEIATAEEAFVSPIYEIDDTVLAAWEVEEWNEKSKFERWKTLATGIYSQPFVLEDDTGQVQIDIGEHVGGERDRFVREHYVSGADQGVEVGGVVAEFEHFEPDLEVGAEEATPEWIRSFVGLEYGLTKQRGHPSNELDIGNAHGDRRFTERRTGIDESVTVVGQATAVEGATDPDGPEDLVIEPPRLGQFAIFECDEATLRSRTVGGRYEMVAGVALLALGVAIVSFGTPLGP